MLGLVPVQEENRPSESGRLNAVSEMLAKVAEWTPSKVWAKLGTGLIPAALLGYIAYAMGYVFWASFLIALNVPNIQALELPNSTFLVGDLYVATFVMESPLIVILGVFKYRNLLWEMETLFGNLLMLSFV